MPVRRVVLVSGVYDLRPLVHTSVNTILGLTAAEAESLSPALMPVRASTGAPSVVVTWGDNETDAFKAQMQASAERVCALLANGSPLDDDAAHAAIDDRRQAG